MLISILGLSLFSIWGLIKENKCCRVLQLFLRNYTHDGLHVTFQTRQHYLSLLVYRKCVMGHTVFGCQNSYLHIHIVTTAMNHYISCGGHWLDKFCIDNIFFSISEFEYYLIPPHLSLARIAPSLSSIN